MSMSYKDDLNRLVEYLNKEKDTMSFGIIAAKRSMKNWRNTAGPSSERWTPLSITKSAKLY